MKRKITAIFMAVAMSFGTVSSYAAGIKDVIESVKPGLLGNPIYVEVPTDISLRKNGETSYVNGPLSYYMPTFSDTLYDFKADIDMSNVIDKVADFETAARLLANGDPTLEAEIDSAVANGQFVITIEYPTANFEIPNSFITGTSMAGFSDADAQDARDFTQVFTETIQRDANTPGKIIIKIDATNVPLAKLKAHLSDLSLECTGVTIKDFGTYQVKGKVEGSTTIKTTIDDNDPNTDDTNNNEIGTITYVFNQEQGKEDPAGAQGDITGTVTIGQKNPQSGSLSGGVVAENTVTIIDGETKYEFDYKQGTKVNVSDLPIPSKEGYVIAGLYLDEEMTQPVGETIEMTKDFTLYVQWEEEIVPPLVFDDHFAYVIGYPVENGREEVRPENNITREEIATIFYRLLTDEARDAILSSENDFTDVSVDRWSNKAVSTMANGGYIKGYEDGSFKPANPITRAEFATIVARFYNMDTDSIVENDLLVDIDGHWAENAIQYTVQKGLVNGYEGNVFNPDKYITRAEVMKVINKMLNRSVNEEGLTEDAKRWVDNSADKWYYYEVIEATNAHTYDRADGETYETWTAVVENNVLQDKPKYEDA